MRTFVLFALTLTGTALVVDDASAGPFNRNRGGGGYSSGYSGGSCDCGGGYAGGYGGGYSGGAMYSGGYQVGGAYGGPVWNGSQYVVPGAGGQYVPTTA